MKKDQHIKHEIVLVGPADVCLLDERISRINRLHVQCSNIVGQVLNLQQIAIAKTLQIGSLLCDIKAESAHGEWGKLFKDRKNSNSARVRNFDFSQDTAKRYMSLFKEAKSRAKKELGNASPFADGNVYDVEAVAQVLPQITNAETIRQLYFEWDIMRESAPTKRGANLDAGDRHTEGRPKKEELALTEGQTEEEISAARKLRSREWAKIVSMGETYIEDGLHLVLAKGERQVFAARLIELAQQILNDK